MQIFLDTANVEDIKKAAASGCLHGVTTNPTIISRESKPFSDCVKDIIKVDKNLTVLVEVSSRNTLEMVQEARAYVKLSPNIVVKIPAIESGLAAVKILSQEKIPTTVTLVFSLNQALMASMAGASFIAPFVGRLDDIDSDGLSLIKDIRQTFRMQSIDTKIITASIRSPHLVSQLFKTGADIVTVPYKVFSVMMKHPLTDSGLKKFEEDWKKVPDTATGF